jgi:hypothetical protein
MIRDIQTTPCHDEQWNELARVLGRSLADHDFEKMLEWQRQHEDEPAPKTTACEGCGRKKPATELKRGWTGEKIVRQYWHQECLDQAMEAAWSEAIERLKT